MQKKAIVWFLSLFTVLLLIGVGHRTLISFGMKTFLQGKLPPGGKVEFSYDRACWEEGKCVLKCVHIDRLEGRGNGPFHMEMDDLKIALDFEFFPFKFSPKVEMERPLVALSEGQQTLGKKGKGIYLLLTQWLFKTPLEIKEGRVLVGKEKVTLTLKTAADEHPGFLLVGKEGEEGTFRAEFSRANEEIHFQVQMEQIDTAWAFSTLQFFLRGIDPKVIVEEGTLNGELAFSIGPPQKIHYIKYNFHLEDFHAHHSKYGLKVEVQEVIWKEHFTSNEEMGEWSAHPFFNKVWPYFVGEGEVRGMHVTFEDALTDKVWAAAHVNGAIRFSQLTRPLLEFHGLFHAGSKEIPFQLAGEAAIEDETVWKVAFDTRFLSEKEMGAHLSVTSSGEKNFLVDLELEHIAPEQLGLFQHLASYSYPFFKDVHVEGGHFSGKGIGLVENGSLKRCEILSFQGDNVALSSAHQKWNGELSKVIGQGEFDLSTVDFFDGTFWELKVSEGRLDFGDQKEIKEIELLVSMHDQYIKPSTLKCQCQGVEAAIAFEGLCTHLNLHTDLLLSFEQLAKTFQVKGVAPSPPIPLDFDCRLKTTKEQFEIEGVAALLKDTLSFGAAIDRKGLKEKGLISALEMGWFKGDSISAETLNMPLVLSEKTFRLEGTVNLEGTFNKKGVELTIDPTHFSYRSKAIDIKPQVSLGSKAPNCNFFYDFETREWRGKIPLKKAKVIEHSFGIVFDAFSSEVDLEGSEFLFQNVDALSSGIHFQAEMAVDFSLEDRNHLKIDTYAIDGAAQDALSFLHHFDMFKEAALPLQGAITSGPGEMHLSAYVGDVEELLEWRIGLHFQDGVFPFSETLGFENLAGDLFFSAEDKRLKVEKVEGQLKLRANRVERSYDLNVPVLEMDALEGVLIYDCRLESPTYEICRIVGNGREKEGEFFFRVDPESTRFFGARVAVDLLTFKEGKLSRGDLGTTLSALDVVHHLDFLSAAGVLPVSEETLFEMRGPLVEGEVGIRFKCNLPNENLSFAIESSKLHLGPIDLDHLKIEGKREGDRFYLSQFDAGALKAKVQMDRTEEGWHFPELQLIWKSSFIDGGGGFFNQNKKCLSVPLSGLRVDLEELTPLFPPSEMNWSYLPGVLFADGEMEIDVSKGLRQWELAAEVSLIGENIGKGRLRLESPHPLRFSISRDKGFLMGGGDFNFLHPRSNHLWAKCHLDTLHIEEGNTTGENVRIIVPPEMVHFLGQTHAIPYLQYEEERLLVNGLPLQWDNQIEASFDFCLGETSTAQGYLKEGYYWVKDQAWYLSGCFFALDGGELSLNLNTLYQEIPFDVGLSMEFDPMIKGKMVIRETGDEEGAEDPLVILTDWNENEGFYIQSMDGQVCGLDFAFHHNPKESFLDKMALKGQLKVNVPEFSKILPEDIQETLQSFEIGKGYELSGDLVLSKETLEESHFTGYLKGKQFELLGSRMETLMSEIDIRPGHIELDNFSVSDVSGLFAIDSVRIHNVDDVWNLVIPEATVTDFRPSRLKKIGKYPTRIKPLTIRSLTATNIQGVIGDIKSFHGEGTLNFINTFKRDAHFLDIPFEILGRLGLDTGLLVPVHGDLTFALADGRVFLTELLDSYSEGKRSHFYLSPMERSYIDFQGNIHVNIKMKQHVLLKVTEPFTLSIGGTFESPKYGLH